MADVKLALRFERRQCDYRLGGGVVARLPEFVGEGPVAVLLDGGVAKPHGERLSRAVRDAAGQPWPALPLTGGEAVKTLAELDGVLRWLATVRLPRDGTLVGVGGGALLDLAGLAASLWARGVRYVAVPTTLLAMADASVGGKTAVNVAGIKNQAGTFHPATAVIADPEFLATLPLREWRSGLAEVIKAAVIGSPRLFASLERRQAALRRCFGGSPAQGPSAAATATSLAVGTDLAPAEAAGLPWASWIAGAVRVKGRVVAADPREEGPRRALNLGHTLGHALEVSLGLSHGEAVAIGMAAAAQIATRRGLCPAPETERIIALLAACGLPVRPPAAGAGGRATEPTGELMRLIAADKKSLGGAVGWVLPERIGAVRIDQRVEPAELSETLGSS